MWDLGKNLDVIKKYLQLSSLNKPIDISRITDINTFIQVGKCLQDQPNFVDLIMLHLRSTEKLKHLKLRPFTELQKMAMSGNVQSILDYRVFRTNTNTTNVYRYVYLFC